MSKLARQITVKAFGKGKEAGDEQLAKINRYALEPLTKDQVYVRRYLVAHNGIDRDKERFTEALLDQFAKTLSGKGMFFNGHPSSWSGTGGPGSGRWFDAGTEEMSPEEFKQLTGEEIVLPEGIEQVTALWGESYMLKDLSYMDEWIKLIDAGIVSFISIGFKAPWFEVTDERGNYKYGEYRPNGEALEASLVWLGAQPGAAAKSAQGDQPETPNPKEKKRMKEFLGKLGKALGLKQALAEENAIEEIASVVEGKETKIKELEPLAADGRAYRKSLVDDTLRFGVMIEEVPTDEAGQKSEAEFLETLPVERLKTMRDKFETRAREKFPDKFTFTGKDEGDREQRGKEAGKKAAETNKRKDLTDPEHNELFATVGK